jgi:DNA-binding MarR family transcriptional regulator
MENILKYWKVVREWMKAKHNLSQSDLDMLLFLYDEGTFRQCDIVKFEKLLSWDRKRQKRLMDSGWIALLVERTPKRNTTYRLTLKGKRALTEMYKRLYGEVFDESNPLYRNDAGYQAKRYRRFIENLNQERIQLLRHGHE